jgi:hypothetical protein
MCGSIRLGVANRVADVHVERPLWRLLRGTLPKEWVKKNLTMQTYPWAQLQEDQIAINSHEQLRQREQGCGEVTSRDSADQRSQKNGFFKAASRVKDSQHFSRGRFNFRSLEKFSVHLASKSLNVRLSRSATRYTLCTARLSLSLDHRLDTTISTVRVSKMTFRRLLRKGENRVRSQTTPSFLCKVEVQSGSADLRKI